MPEPGAIRRPVSDCQDGHVPNGGLRVRSLSRCAWWSLASARASGTASTNEVKAARRPGSPGSTSRYTRRNASLDRCARNDRTERCVSCAFS